MATSGVRQRKGNIYMAKTKDGKTVVIGGTGSKSVKGKGWVNSGLDSQD